jgi:hypothetical protein
MNVKKGVFRLVVVVSVLVGLFVVLFCLFFGVYDELKSGLQLQRNKELSKKQDKYDLDKHKTEEINKKKLFAKYYDGDYLTPEQLREENQEIEHLKRDIIFWNVMYKSLWLFIPLSSLLIGFLSVWIVYYTFYYTIRYVVVGFVTKGKEKSIEEKPSEKRFEMKFLLQKLKQKKLIAILVLTVIMILIISLISFLDLEEQNTLDRRLEYLQRHEQLSTTTERVESNIPFDNKSLISGNAGVDIIGYFSGSLYNGSKWAVNKIKFKVVAKDKNGGVRWTRDFVYDFSHGDVSQFLVHHSLEPLTAESFSVYAGDTNVTSCDWYIVEAWGYPPKNQ